MPAISEQTTIDPVSVTKPTVTYDQSDPANLLINVTVIVSTSSDPIHPLHFDAPIFVVPGSGLTGVSATWKVIWKVTPGSGLESVIFTEGILIPADPSRVPDAVTQISSGPDPDHLDQWTATITHHVEDVNSFNYRMFVRGISGSTITPDSHDPAIAVVKDPMDG